MYQRGSASSGVLFGVILVVVGAVLLLERLNVLPTNLMNHFWPLLIAFIGLGFLAGNRFPSVSIHGKVRDRGPGEKAFGVLFLTIAAGLELEKWGVIRSFRVWDLWPVYLIGLGAFLLWRALHPPDPTKQSNEILDSRVSEYAIFGGGDLRIVTDNFIGGNLTAVFGGHEVDFTSCKIASSPAVLYADAIFGGVSMRVPQSWYVTVNGPAIFGGMESKTLRPSDSEGPEQRLIVKGMAIFGGIEIKN